MLMLKLQGDLVFFAFATIDDTQEGRMRICQFPVANLTSNDTNDMLCLHRNS